MTITPAMVARIQAWSNGSWEATWAKAAADSEWAPVLRALLAAGVDPTAMVQDFRRYYGNAKNDSYVASVIPVWSSKLPAAAPAQKPSAPAASAPIIKPSAPTVQSRVTGAVQTIQNVVTAVGGQMGVNTTVGGPTGSGILGAVGAVGSALQSIFGGPSAPVVTPAPATSLPSVFNTPAQNAAITGGSSNNGLLLLALGLGLVLALGD